MIFESELRLVNSILASCVLTFHSPYSPRNDGLIHILGCADIFCLWMYCIARRSKPKLQKQTITFSGNRAYMYMQIE